MMMGGQGNCKIIKRCTSPKPLPMPGCKWVKKCSPSMTQLGFGVPRPIVSPVVSPVIYGGRPYSPYRLRHRRHHYARRISPYATTVIGRGRGPIRRVSVSPRRPMTVSPRRAIVSPRRR
jgi:hypothetical protein